MELGILLRDHLTNLIIGAESPLVSVTIRAGKQVFWDTGSIPCWIADVFYAIGTIGITVRRSLRGHY